MTEYYVAFSIHNSYTFITANRTMGVAETFGKKIVVDGFEFTKGKSRTSSLRGATKLLSRELEMANGSPTKDPQVVIAFFEKLAQAGWDVDDAAFREKHKLTKRDTTPAKSVETKTEFSPETPPAVDPIAAKMASAAAAIIEKLPTPTEDKPLYSPVGDPNRGVVPVEGLREENLPSDAVIGEAFADRVKTERENGTVPQKDHESDNIVEKTFENKDKSN